MSSLTQIGYSGLHAAQISLTVAGQNIANVNTPGFSRLSAQLHSVGGRGGSRVGGGVEVTSIHRMTSEFHNRQLWLANTQVNFHSSSQQYLTALEGLIGSEGSSISAGLDNFFAALSEATSTPESIVLRQQILNEAKQLAQRFNSLSGNINTQIGAIHGQRTALVDEVNGLLGNIADLNKRIAEQEAVGGETGALRDHRDSLIKDLSQFADIRVQELQDGAVAVSLANGEPLVIRGTASELKLSTNAAGEQELTLIFANSTFNVPQQDLGGTLGGLHEAEYGALRPVLDDLHAMAGQLADLVNDLLATGVDLNNGTPGKPLFSYDPNSITSMLTVEDLAPEELAFSSAADEPGNNDVLLELIELRHKTITVNGSQVSLNDAYAGIVSRVASASRQNQADLKASEEVLRDAQAKRDSVSAVSLDEEAVNLMTYMQAYQANMKVIGVADKMFETLLTMF